MKTSPWGYNNFHPAGGTEIVCYERPQKNDPARTDTDIFPWPYVRQMILRSFHVARFLKYLLQVVVNEPYKKSMVSVHIRQL